MFHGRFQCLVKTETSSRWYQTSRKTPDMSCTTDGATFKKRILIACLILIWPDNVIGKDCRAGQKLRVNKQGDQICCNTVKCGKSQQFYYCQYDGEKDICRNCSNDSYTDDLIDTSQWPIHDNGKYQVETQICSPLPSCKAEEVVLVGRKCQCNLNEGYWGTDEHNCKLDKQNCKRAGVQLTYEGNCVPCSGDTFKQEDDKYGQCINKTVCKSHERENSRGSSTTDRTCEKLPTEKTPITTAPPDTGTTNKPEKEDDNSISGGTVAVIVLIIVIVLVIIAVPILYKRNKRFAGCFLRFVEYCQRGFQRLTGHRQPGPQFEAVPLNEHRPVEHSENESDESQTQEISILMDGTKPSNGINGHYSPLENGAVGSNKNSHNKPRVSKTDRHDTNLKKVSNEAGHLSSLEEETDPKSVIIKDESERNIPTTVEEAESHPLGKTKDSDGFPSLSSSIYEDRSGFGSSGHEADHSALSSHDRHSESILAKQPFIHNNTTMSANATSTSTGNRPSSSLIEDLETMEDPPNESKKTPVITPTVKKPKVIGLVAPTPRSPDNNPENPNFGQADNRLHQHVPPSNTTAGGIDVEIATNDQDYKIAPSTSNRTELEPLIVNIPDKQQTENQHSVEPSVTNADNGIAENAAQPPQISSSENGVQSTHRSLSDNGAHPPHRSVSDNGAQSPHRSISDNGAQPPHRLPSENQSQPPHRSSSENLIRPLRSSGTTDSGQPLGAPESDNSQGSSTAQNSMEDNPQQNNEANSRDRTFD